MELFEPVPPEGKLITQIFTFLLLLQRKFVFNFFVILFKSGEDPWVHNPANPFEEPTWVTEQRMVYFERRKRKDQFRQESIDIAHLDHQKKVVNQEKHIESVKKCHEKHAKALFA